MPHDPSPHRSIAHLSDVHFGKIITPEVVDDLVGEINRLDPDLVVISGDLTQRARHSEFEQAKRMIEAFHSPALVVPGNHDVHPWWRPADRLLRPLSRYKRYLGDDLAPQFASLGADEEDRVPLSVLGINSAYGRTVKGGRINTKMRESVPDFFEDQPEDAFRVLVLHHHLTRILRLGPHDVARKARKLLRLAVDSKVELILCGHLHVSHVHAHTEREHGRRLVIASAGTATSSRGRLSNRRTNYYNVVTVAPEWFEVEERRYLPDTGNFERDRTTRFERHPVVEVEVEEEDRG